MATRRLRHNCLIHRPQRVCLRVAACGAIPRALVMGWIIFIPVAVRMWRSAWIFEITADRLIATHQFARRCHEIPWGSIAAVTKLSPLLFLGSSPRQFSRIVTTDERELLFNPHLDQ